MPLFISNEDMNDVIKIIIRKFGCINWWCNWNSKKWNKKVGFLGALLAALVTSLVKPVISSIVKDISREELEEQEEDVWLKCFSSAPSFKQYRDYYFNDEPRFNSLPRIKDGAYVINLS